MSGTNLMLKEGTVLFREGDESDGMYVVRQGEILIYLEKGEQEVKLANVTGGAMIGEMALFDKKPRSASAKAIKDTEVTKISNDDFVKIMKQIPKWFVTLMTSLSTRLRETNERLQKLESKSGGHKKPLEDVTRIIGVLGLLWHKDGTKDAKAWILEKEPAETEIVRTLGIERKIVSGVVTALVKAKLISSKPNSYKKDVLSIANKGVLEKFLDFAADFIKTVPGAKSLSESGIELLGVLKDMAEESAYETATISLEDLCAEGERRSINTTNWRNDIQLMKNLGEACKLVKVSGGVGFKVVKKELARLVERHQVLLILDKAGVS